MKNLSNLITSVITFIVILLIGWGVFWGIKLILSQFEVIEPQAAAIVSIAFVALILVALIISSAIRKIVRKEDKHIHPEKAIIYRQFVENWYMQNGNQKSEKQAYDLHKAMALWAGNNVLKEYMILIKKEATSDKTVQIQAEKVLKEIRKDLGNQSYFFGMGKINKMLIG